MVNWLYMCVAIVKYAQQNILQILTMPDTENISFKKVLSVYETSYPKDNNAKRLSEYLIQYFLSRQLSFAKDFSKRDFISEWDMTTDKTYKFVFNDLDGLV